MDAARALPTEPWSHLLTFNPALIQFTEWTGTLGAALWVVVVNGLLVEIWQTFRTRRRLTAAATAGAALLVAMAVPIYGTRRMAQVGRENERADRACNVAVVQTNLDLFIKHDMARAEQNTAMILGLARAAAPESDLVILPESVLPGYLLHRLSQSERPDAGPLAGTAVETGVPILAGRFYVRIRSAKDTGLRNLPCRAWNENAAWLEVVLTAVDLIAWTKLICFADVVELARCEIAAFRYRVLHVAARLTRGSRQVRLRIDKTWRWAVHIAEGFHRLRLAARRHLQWRIE